MAQEAYVIVEVDPVQRCDKTQASREMIMPMSSQSRLDGAANCYFGPLHCTEFKGMIDTVAIEKSLVMGAEDGDTDFVDLLTSPRVGKTTAHVAAELHAGLNLKIV